MTPEIAAAIIDWRDEDNEVTPGGAEADYYASLQPPYLPRNGPLETVRELLMVRGISRELLLGNDPQQNGELETEEEIATAGRDTGWAGLFTVDSVSDNVNAAGQERVNIQTADERSLTAVRGLTPEIAKAIVAYRGQNRFESIADLLDVTAAPNQNQPDAGGNPASNPDQTQAPPFPNPASPNQPAAKPPGPKVISENLLEEIADDLTVQSGDTLPGLMNINTAGLEALVCLPGLDRQSAQAIISYRQSSGFFPNIAHLLRVQGVTRETFKQVAPRVTVRSETFRILSKGRVSSSGARQRIQEIVHVGLHRLITLSYREDDL
jgi:competence ComEA-like helix-hairpin-helix protein